MPGILLYGNGMKVEFKIKLEYDKKNNIRAAIAIILAIVMYVTIDFTSEYSSLMDFSIIW